MALLVDQEIIICKDFKTSNYTNEDQISIYLKSSKQQWSSKHSYKRHAMSCTTWHGTTIAEVFIARHNECEHNEKDQDDDEHG